MARKLVLTGGTEEGNKAGAFIAGVFAEFSLKAESATEKALEQAALKVETTAKLLFRPSEAVSEDGLPPRVQTGRARASITHRLKRTSGKMEAEVGTNVEYARALEYGTSRTYKHPFLRPALDKNVQLIVKLERDAIRQAAKNVT